MPSFQFTKNELKKFLVANRQCAAKDFDQDSNYSTISGIAAYRSALTLDQLAQEEFRQSEYAHVFEKDGHSQDLENSVCTGYLRPGAGKVARLMLELLKNLEGDDDLIQELGHTLVRTKLLVKTSQLEAEPNLPALVQTQQAMQGEPYVTLPRVLAVAWVLASDPQTTKANGWCSIQKLTNYLDAATPSEIAVQMRRVDPILARARYILEDFVQSMMPIPVYTKRQLRPEELKFQAQMQKRTNRHLNSTNATFSPDGRRSDGSPTRTELPTVTATTLQKTPKTTQRVIRLIEPQNRNDAAAITYTYVSLVLCLFVI